MDIAAPSPIAIRQAVRGDAQALADLDKDAFGPEVAWRLDSFQSALASPSSDAQLALLGDKPVGYVLMRYGNGAVNVDSLGVSSAARGHKIGERLLLGGLEKAAENGCSQVTLQVENGNAPAEKLYAKYGFQPTKILPGYYHGKDGTEMTLPELQSAQKQEFLAQRHAELKAALGSFPQSKVTITG